MFFTIPPAVFRANVFCTDLQEDDVTPFTFMSQSAQLKNSTNTAGWAQKPSLQVLQLLSSMPTPHCLQRTDKGSARPQAHAPVRQCHRCDVTRRQIITYAIYAWPLPPAFYRWRIAWGQANKLGKPAGRDCVSWPWWVVGQMLSLGGVVLGQHCGLQPASSAARYTTSISTVQPRTSVLRPKVQLKSHRTDDCPALRS